MNTPGTGREERLAPLDGLRGLAILLVLFHHLFVYQPAGPVGERLGVLAEFAGHGVDLFFVLSGFLIARQLLAHQGQPGFCSKFWIHRIAKIVPLYLAICLAVFILLKPALIFSGNSGKLAWLLSAQENAPWYFFFASNFRNALDGRFTNPALDVCWSLGIEVQFYLLAFFAAQTVPRSKWIKLMGLAIGVAILSRGFGVIAGANWIQILVLTPGRLDAFALGGLAAAYPKMLAKVPSHLLWLACALPMLTSWRRDLPAVEVIGYTLVALIAAVAVERAARPRNEARGPAWLSGRFLRFAGKVSYSTYLIHVPVRAALRDYFLPAERMLVSPADFLRQAVFFFGAGSLCLLVGWGAWRGFEEPARKWILRFTRSSASQRPIA